MDGKNKAAKGGRMETGTSAAVSSDLLRGHTETIVLRILMRGDAYGFEIYNRILERTGEQYELKETTLYSSYKRLEAEGCITSYWGDETQGARRKYYRITKKAGQYLNKTCAIGSSRKKLSTNYWRDNERKRICRFPV